MTTNYISSHGMVWGEMNSTGVVTSYGHDALGSVTETYQNGALQNTYRYKPYGGLLAKTGTAPDPSFLWNGGSGYRATILPNSDYYVRRRHFSTTSGLWISSDPLWPAQPPYNHANSSPATLADPSGQGPGGCFSLFESQLQKRSCDLVASYFGSKCQKGKKFCRVDADLKATGTLSFVVETNCLIGRNPCAASLTLKCDKHVQQPPKTSQPVCPAPYDCVNVNYCQYKSSTGINDPGPFSGQIKDPLGNWCNFTITDIKFTGTYSAYVVTSECKQITHQLPPRMGN